MVLGKRNKVADTETPYSALSLLELVYLKSSDHNAASHIRVGIRIGSIRGSFGFSIAWAENVSSFPKVINMSLVQTLLQLIFTIRLQKSYFVMRSISWPSIQERSSPFAIPISTSVFVDMIDDNSTRLP